jgi:hypothetical protein
MDRQERDTREQFVIRMNPREKAQLATIAESRGLPLSTTARALVREEYQRLRGGPFGEPIKVAM